MNDYLSTPNAQLLEKILHKSLRYFDISEKDIFAAATDFRRTDTETRVLSIMSFAHAIMKYIDEKGAVSKGEVAAVGEKISSAHAWQINRSICDTSLLFNGRQNSIKNIFEENEIKSDKIHSFLQDFNESRILLFQDVVKSNHLIWYEEKEKCINYIADFLTVKAKEDSHRYTFVGKDKREKARKLYENAVVQLSEEKPAEPSEEFSPLYFSRKYGLDDSFYISQTKIFKSEMERALFDGGLTDPEERRKVLSMILRNYSFFSLFTVNGSEYLSREKIKSFASIYTGGNYEERNDILLDFQKVFLKKEGN